MRTTQRAKGNKQRKDKSGYAYTRVNTHKGGDHVNKQALAIARAHKRHYHSLSESVHIEGTKKAQKRQKAKGAKKKAKTYTSHSTQATHATHAKVQVAVCFIQQFAKQRQPPSLASDVSNVCRMFGLSLLYSHIAQTNQKRHIILATTGSPTLDRRFIKISLVPAPAASSSQGDALSAVQTVLEVSNPWSEPSH